MTTGDQSREPRPIDADIDAAWRTLPHDEPPPALDAAIRAAARRAVGARPGRVREAARPQRWWWPLAAAATIGAVTIGILQLEGPERRDPMRSEPAVVSDMPPSRAPSAQKPTADAKAPTEMATPATSPGPATPATPAAPAAPATPAAEAPPAVAAPPAPAKVARPPATRPPAPRTGAPAAVAPKPRDDARAGAAESRARDAGRIERPAEEAVPGAEGRASDAVVANPFPAAPPGTAPATTAREPFPAAGTEPAKRREPPQAMPLSRQERAGAESRVSSGAASAESTPMPSPVEWIARIRKLRAEGRIDEAARELAAFRGAHPEYALPPDLRDWRPNAAKGESPAPR